MARRTMLAALALLLGGWSSIALAHGYAPPESARLVSADAPCQPDPQTHWLQPAEGQHAAVVLRHVANRAVIIDRALALTPVRPWLIEVRVADTTVYLDPCKDYLRLHQGHIDPNQYIPRAQSLWRGLVAGHARIVRAPGAAAYATPDTTPQPRVIIMKPDSLRHQDQTPATPRPHPKHSDLLALAPNS